MDLYRRKRVASVENVDEGRLPIIALPPPNQVKVREKERIAGFSQKST